jgi:hypothetical protein
MDSWKEATVNIVDGVEVIDINSSFLTLQWEAMIIGIHGRFVHEASISVSSLELFFLDSCTRVAVCVGAR